ncbi:glycosyltransferase [Prochlorococcus marinus]|uniref:glycosyltransferase n=1 Tax=Prochlorococcus marinus TaxID=1219 RepID=UPI0022B3829A|nr:glycosyltransferase family 2 protein [Prochlorococcus marinus]
MALARVTGENRRGKACLFLFACAFAGALPHSFDAPYRLFPALLFLFLLGSYGLRVVLLARSRASISSAVTYSSIPAEDLPSVDVLVSARDEETVVEKLINRLANVQYPEEKINICIINDGSQDNTASILEEKSQTFSNIKILHRAPSSGGGKSGALNYALQKLSGEWVFILDADADFPPDILLRLMPVAKEGSLAAIQLRKAVVNSQKNFLTCCQSMEMAMDAVIQEGRQNINGVVELRGNGELLNRIALDSCGGFNEETVTDDLDLSFRFLISGASIGILWNPPVTEEGVESLQALLRQRKRWAEGGLQRFFDYWSLLISKKLTIVQLIDLIAFFLLQYALPVISFFDLFIALVTKTLPLYWPLSLVAFTISGFACFRGAKKYSSGPNIPSPHFVNLLMFIIYLSHWFFVIPLITINMAFRSKKLIWLKTTHKGF